MRITKKSYISVAAGMLGLAGVVLAPVASAANTTTITAQVQKTASVATTSGTVSLNITPTSAGSFTSLSDTVTAGTNSATGYQLQISAATTALTNGGNTIAASSGTLGTPTALAVNTWGYRIDGQGGFGAGPTSATPNGASLPLTWAGVTTTPTTVKTTASSSNADVTTVWYGAGVDFTKVVGNYSTTVTYTTVAN